MGREMGVERGGEGGLKDLVVLFHCHEASSSVDSAKSGLEHGKGEN